jgi:hypothetical protein
MLFIRVTCRSHFDFYLLSFLSTGSAFTYTKISSILLWLKRVCPAVFSEKFHLYLRQFFCLRVQISLTFFLPSNIQFRPFDLKQHHITRYQYYFCFRQQQKSKAVFRGASQTGPRSLSAPGS